MAVDWETFPGKGWKEVKAGFDGEEKRVAIPGDGGLMARLKAFQCSVYDPFRLTTPCSAVE